jgi:hypothetical protein
LIASGTPLDILPAWLRQAPKFLRGAGAGSTNAAIKQASSTIQGTGWSRDEYWILFFHAASPLCSGLTLIDNRCDQGCLVW